VNEIVDFDRAVCVHPDVPVILLITANAGELSARMRVGPPPPEVIAAVRWDTGEEEWHVGTHVGGLPPALRRYYEDLSDVDAERRRLDSATPGLP
jgi:hypothetical protein